jgi:hypothetical protein
LFLFFSCDIGCPITFPGIGGSVAVGGRGGVRDRNIDDTSTIIRRRVAQVTIDRIPCGLETRFPKGLSSTLTKEGFEHVSDGLVAGHEEVSSTETVHEVIGFVG